MSWWEWFDLFTEFDWAEIYVNDIVVFQHCESGYTAPTAWVKQTIDLRPYTGGLANIEFHMMATTVVNYSGWYIDDLEIYNLDPTPTSTPIGPTATPSPISDIPDIGPYGMNICIFFLSGIIGVILFLKRI
ncbi:MAG: hypothetical protein A2161_02550 [Candidatus Schekmanbacteria bacterium RBG_13_48_7]|uniref:Uncharacterized protein n=1 Tax=Candidatus Schekmanbacteria bacterium RBG_13_48_7 TaxID=1817878 RepID=A0A1F7RJL8_9BACT|nr:MAG: hypothetical protein A2161_02550 [Candidatus Schekmanbacteria bacterium RBG_13_48_7]